MKTDRSIRSLAALGGASSGRVLNLLAIPPSAEVEECDKKPLFYSSSLNSCIILKHRLRPDEVDCFEQRRSVATKIIIPFQKAELRIGGQSLFIGQRGFDELISEVANFRDPQTADRDLRVLKLLDAIPSLDPFILREYLRSSEIEVDESYFRISPPEQRRMYEYAKVEMGRLTSMATGASEKSLGVSATKLTSALLSNEADERLDPLRLTLNLRSADFLEGIFGWRGFIYYKWSIEDHWPKFVEALRGIKTCKPSGYMDADTAAFLENSKTSILRGAKRCSDEVRSIISIYDKAYDFLIENQKPKFFRQFLLDAPSLFLNVGEKIGAMSHISTFWQYRFPNGTRFNADADELTVIFEDFLRSLGTDDGLDQYRTAESRVHLLNC